VHRQQGDGLGGAFGFGVVQVEAEPSG
jgi:hypothetical protein